MMQKIQKFGGAMFTPVLLFAFAGISVGIGTLFTTQAIMGSLAAPTNKHVVQMLECILTRWMDSI